MVLLKSILGYCRLFARPTPTRCLYAPQSPLTDAMASAVNAANVAIATNTEEVGAVMADIRRTFRGHESDAKAPDLLTRLMCTIARCKLLPDNSRRCCRIPTAYRDDSLTQV